MFVGQYEHALDAKFRLTIPSRLRDELATGLVMTRGYDPCICIYPLDEWALLCERADHLPMANQDARDYARLIFSGAYETRLDKMGRVLVPTFLRDYAEIESETIILGLNQRVEVWSPPRWEKRLQTTVENLGSILDSVAKMGM